MTGPNPGWLKPGDALPRIALPSASGQPVNFADQRLAGKAVLFWLLPEPDDAPIQQLVAVADALAALDTLACVVSSKPIQGEFGNLLCLVDAERAFATALGVVPPALAVVGPSGRLAEVRAGMAIAEAQAIAVAMHEQTRDELVRSQAPVLLLERVLEPDLCQRLIAHWRAGEKVADGIAATSRGSRVADQSIKRRRDVVLDDMGLYAPFRDRIGQRVLPEIQRAFNVRITQMEAPRIGCYAAEEGGLFRAHRDNTTKFTAHRLFAMSLNLNTGYGGGELRFPEFGRQLYSPPAGGAVVFSCSLLHEARPVTAGQRFGIFTFFHDEAGEAQVQRLLAEERQAGRTGHAMRQT